MKLELDLDIETILAEAVKEAISPERIQNQINTHVNNAVENALDKALNRWSPFSKALEEQVKEAMPIGDYQVPRYHDYIIKAVQESIAESQQEMAQRMVNERIKDLVGGEFPKEMKLSEMLKLFYDEMKPYDGHYNPTIIVEDCGREYSNRHINIYMDRDSNKSMHSCEFQIRLHDSRDKQDEYYVWDFEHQDIKSSRYIGCKFNQEGVALNLYTGRTKIIIDTLDVDEIRSNWDEEEHED